MFRRGFKTWCETVSSKWRSDFGLSDYSPLDPSLIAASLGVVLLSPDDIPEIPSKSRTVLMQESADWSAVTVSQGDRVAVVSNSKHSLGRNSSDVMHELAHLLLDHRPSTVVVSADATLVLRSFDTSQEDEANWLAGCLLLPRPALLRIAKRGMTDLEACAEYRVSQELLTYRKNITGVARQMRYGGAPARR